MPEAGIGDDVLASIEAAEQIGSDEAKAFVAIARALERDELFKFFRRTKDRLSKTRLTELNRLVSHEQEFIAKIDSLNGISGKERESLKTERL